MAALHQRYAQALIDLVAAGKAEAATLRRDLETFAAMLKESLPLQRTLASPAVEWRQKKRVVEAIAARADISGMGLNFLLVAVQRGRATALPGMVAAFDELLLKREGVVKADVDSARPLDDRQKQAIEQELGRLTGRKLLVRYGSQPELIGGFRARVGDTVFDGSLRGRLDRMKEALTGA